MRHQLTRRFVVVLAAVLVIAVVVWAGLAQTVTASDDENLLSDRQPADLAALL